LPENWLLKETDVRILTGYRRTIGITIQTQFFTTTLYMSVCLQTHVHLKEKGIM